VVGRGARRGVAAVRESLQSGEKDQEIQALHSKLEKLEATYQRQKKLLDEQVSHVSSDRTRCPLSVLAAGCPQEGSKSAVPWRCTAEPELPTATERDGCTHRDGLVIECSTAHTALQCGLHFRPWWHMYGTSVSPRWCYGGTELRAPGGRPSHVRFAEGDAMAAYVLRRRCTRPRPSRRRARCFG
jgi:hypothetical protein